ncbi:MAG: UDP-N-acetylmuramate dehydrogenase [Proteobacteria bacterium]|nr:UDP-N-acetylmuramate dehydrogenase [Pseudomonadota bacterium]
MSLAVASEFAGRVRYDEPLSRHTSWHVGGPAQVWFNPRDRADLIAFLGSLPPAVPIHWIGLGSNLLVRDGGVPGVVISTHGTLDDLQRNGASGVQAGAGVACARVARQCAQWQLGPAAFFAGIPGTLGGALAMNAGAFGGETWRQVSEVETIDRSGQTRWRAATEYRTGYRQVSAPVAGEWFLGARLSFERSAADQGEEVRALLQRRKLAQPIGEWSCGSVFTNPPGDFAARLIETAGLKGLRIGDASVSAKHANFIVNHGHARAADIEQLIEQVQATVQRVHGVALHPEVRILGEVG